MSIGVGVKVFKKAILPVGYKANGVKAGIKKSGKLDLALIYSLEPAMVSSRNTVNVFKAAPVQLNIKNLKKNKKFQAIIANSGNANAFTGKTGLKDAQEMGSCLARELLINKDDILVASTGIIGKKLPIEKIKNSVCSLVKGLSVEGIDLAKKAIMTTDKFAKEITVKFDVSGKTVTLCGIAKGAGMIAPDMATMLVFILTDADITKQALERALSMATDSTFNCITVDGCMSTNDTVILMANNQAGNKRIDSQNNFNKFYQGLEKVCLELAKMVVSDGEGATKLIHLKVSAARSSAEAKKVALAVANSNLFKTAMYASSKNILGRIVASVGSVGIDVKEDKLKIKYSSLTKKEVDIEVSLGRGDSSAVVYTSDLTHEYVKINAEYN